MTNEQKELIVTMRQSGYGYRKIGNKLELSRDEVRNYCKVRHLCGGVTGQKILLKDDETVCIQCGKPIVNKATGRRRKYCSVKCKQKWEAAHPKKNYEQICQLCGKPFKSSSKSQKYCSHECYVQDRFYRDEQMEYLISQLKKGEVVENAPQWIKDLIGVK
ncbi:MAG: hypothetical protein RR869_06375 [Lachnospiraceae bacterium]